MVTIEQLSFACSLLTSETEGSFIWAFTEFINFFERPPIAIFADGDGAWH